MALNCPKENRERGTVRRSRFGCRNCKLRKLKCDENKPNCKRCGLFGVICNFVSRVPDLQPTATSRGRVLMPQGKANLRTPVVSAVWTCDETTSYQLDAKCQNLVTRCFERSLIIADDPNMIYVNRKLMRLAFNYPFFMHASLAVTFTYDRHLNKVGSRRSIEECYHWSQSTALLNRRLREPMKEKDKDPIWATAAALTILIFSSPDPCKPEESWPLKSSDCSDLDWLHMSKGKMSLWHIVDPLRPDSLFRVMGGAFAQMKPPFPKRGKDGVPDDLAAVCFLSDASTPSDNPYFYAAHAVARLLSLPDSEVTTCRTQIFILNIHSPFEDLLRSRDPVALLLLYLWYRKASPSTWWIALRAKVECPSICLYLQLYHKGNAVVQAFLPRSDLAGKFN